MITMRVVCADCGNTTFEAYAEDRGTCSAEYQYHCQACGSVMIRIITIQPKVAGQVE